jgi:hypothetical protein
MLTLPLHTARSKPCNKPPFSVFTRPLYLAFRGKWSDLAYGISGVWALGPKLQLQEGQKGSNRQTYAFPYPGGLCAVIIWGGSQGRTLIFNT